MGKSGAVVPLKRRSARTLYLRHLTPATVGWFLWLVGTRSNNQPEAFEALVALHREMLGDPKYRKLLRRHRLSGEPPPK